MNKEEHASHLRILLQTIKDRHSFAKFSKCGFWLKSVAFLGHIVSSEPSGFTKDRSSETMARHTSATDIKNFLGLAG